MRIMAILGAFVFSAHDKEFHKMNKTTRYHFAKIDKVHTGTEYHAIGGRDETRVVSGRINALQSGSNPLDALEIMAELKYAYPLFLGTGRYLGRFIIEDIRTVEEKILDNGAAIQVDFTITLQRTDGGLLSWVKSLGLNLGGIL